MNRSSLAKITRPRLPAIVPRERLFRLLDKDRRYPILWITGPAGSGKTTLAASYLAARNISCVWYQIDEGDADLATFFYYLGIAAKKAAPRYRRSLPLFTAEYALGIQTFAKRYFENLFDRLQQPSILVLDNYHEAPPDAPIHAALAAGLDDIPRGTQVFIISRGDPSAPFVRLEANNQMMVFDRNQLLLNHEELTELMHLQCASPQSPDLVQRVMEKTDGWAAGVVLLCHAIGTEAADMRMRESSAEEKIFDYFSNQLFGRADAALQDFLLKTAFMPVFTPRHAEELSGHAGAGEILSGLNRRNFFLEKKFHPEPTYQFHPLFRDFLRTRARMTLSAGDVSGLQRKGAELLEQSGYMEHAASLYRESGTWDAFLHLVLRQAPLLMRQGRNRTLSDWLAAAPTGRVESNPWLLYWRGMSSLHFAPAASTADFERAYSLFTGGKNAAGIFLAWSGVVDSILIRLDETSPLDHWFASLRQIRKKWKRFPTQEIELRVAISMFAALSAHKPDHPDALKWRERMLFLAGKSNDVTQKVLAASQASWHELYIGHPKRSALILRSVERLARSDLSPPLARIMVKAVATIHCWLQGQDKECQELVSDALNIADTSGVHVWDCHALGNGITSALTVGNMNRAHALLQRMEEDLPYYEAVGRAFYHYLASWYAALKGDLHTARELADRGLTYAERTGSMFSVAVGLVGAAAIYHALKNDEESERLSTRALQIAEDMASPPAMFMCNLVVSQFAFDRGRESAGRKALRRALTIGREQGYLNMYSWRSDVMARLCAIALENNIEPEYVRQLIVKRGLLPDRVPLEIDSWPWPIRIYTLGRFEVLRDDKPLEYSRKVQKKPLQLLKVLVAAGGKEVRDDRLASLLWPDARGDAGHKALESAVIRLRRLLGMDGAVKVREGFVSLDNRYCWSDASAFEHLLDRACEARNQATASLQARYLHKAMDIYKGPFLAQDNDPWSIAFREKLRQAFLRCIDELGACMEQSRAFQDVLRIYQRGLEADELAEPYYQRMMVCCKKLGRHAEALSIYNRCRKTLAACDITPSPETEAIRASLRQQG